MGKYIKKDKIKDELAAMDTQNSLGVTTRAKTKLQSSYLELRSRKLEKVLPLINEPKNNKTRPKRNRRGKPSPAKSRSVSIEGLKDQEVGVLELSSKAEELNLDMEPSFGENNPDFDGKDRSTRESTPCSLIKVSDMPLTPGSATRKRASAANNRRMQNALLDIAITREIDQFFSSAEEEQKRKRFIEKYNFDVVNDVPLPGRYEWVKVNN